MISSVSCLLVLLALGHAAISYARKDCIEPLRASSVENGPTCSADFALVPHIICDNDDTTSPKCQKQQSRGSDVCAVVIEALFAEWNMLDGAFLTSGSCHASIHEGRFSALDALRVLPDNFEVIAIRIEGRSLLRALERGLVDYYLHGKMDAYPHTAGLKYELDLLQPEGQRVQNLQLLGFMCNWKPIDDNAVYMILTDANVASTVFASDILTTRGTGRGGAESFFLYATSVCTLEDNWHKMRLQHQPWKIPLKLERSSSSRRMASDASKTIFGATTRSS